MKSPSLLTLVVVLGGLTLPAPVRADPIAITSGFLSSTGLSNVGEFQLNGAGFSVAGNTDMGNVRPAVCFPCPAGTAVPLSSLFTGGLEIDGAVVIDGNTFVGPTGAVFEFDAPAFVLPSTPAGISVRRLFTLTGSLTVFDERGESTVISRMLIGQGEVTAHFDYNPNLGEPIAFEFRSIRYDFTEAAPVPEPVTMLLVGTGLGGVFLRHRSRRRLT